MCAPMLPALRPCRWLRCHAPALACCPVAPMHALHHFASAPADPLPPPGNLVCDVSRRALCLLPGMQPRVPSSAPQLPHGLQLAWLLTFWQHSDSSRVAFTCCHLKQLRLALQVWRKACHADVALLNGGTLRSGQQAQQAQRGLQPLAVHGCVVCLSAVPCTCPALP